jgi:hypothetical protein
MPMRSTPIRDAAGNVIGRACYREPRRGCQTTGCPHPGTLLCDYPVTRGGRKTTCNRYMCDRCAKGVGPGRDFCPPHAKLHSATLEKEAEEQRFREHLAGFTPVKRDE